MRAISIKGVVYGAVVVLLAGLAISWTVGSAMVRGQASLVPPAEHPARDVNIRSGDGVVLAATYWPGRTQNAPGVLLLHGVRSSRASTAPMAAWLAAQGYAALTVDFRGHGESTITTRSFGLREAVDARAAFEWLKHRQHGAPVAVVGNSLGGASALLGQFGPLPAEALILQAVYPDVRRAIRNRIAARVTQGPAYLLEPLLSFQSIPRYGVWPTQLAPIDALGRYRGPVLIIGGEEDQYTPPDETRAMYAAAPGEKHLWLIPSAGHAAIGKLGDQNYRDRVTSFLRHTIGAP